MKIVTFALAILIFSGVVGMFGELDIFNYKIYEPKYNISQSDANGIYTIDEPQIDSKQGLIENIKDATGYNTVMKIWNSIKKFFSYALNMGGLVQKYVPGVVGEQFAILINGITYALYLWGAIQLVLKISTKGME